MKSLKNILVGFLVSFVGSVPLGYLNIIGFEIYKSTGLGDVLSYLGGVVIIEGIVIFATLQFADKLAHNKKLIKYIELFSILFMFLLAYVFYNAATAQQTDGETGLQKYIAYPAFIIGIVFSSLNFIQIPFWTGWNLYLVNEGYISTKARLKYWYLTGTLAGTFCGMLGLILFLSLVANKSGYMSDILMTYIIPGVFFIMGCYQLLKFWQKYYGKNKA